MAFDIKKTNFLLPKNWRLVRLGDIAKVNPEVINREYKKEIIRYIDISSVSSHKFDKPKVIQFNKAPSRARRKLRDNDFIISTVRPNLKQYVFLDKVEDNWICSTGFCVVRADNENLAWYLYALITSDIFTSYLTKVADGAAYPAFNPIEIENAIIPMPTDFVIEKIANNIKCFNNKIHLNHQINQTLEQMAQAIFKSWFVDFDPVKAKMDALAQGADKKTATISAMATISGQSQDELASLKANRPNDYQRLYDIADAFPSEMVDGVPLGWDYSPIADKSILTIIKPSIDKFDGEKEYIATANVSQNNIVGNLEKITYKKRPSRANMQPIIGSIWFAKMVGEHKAIMIDKDDDFLLGNTVLSTGFLGIMPNKNLNSFLYCYINSEKFLQDKYSLATGAVQVALNNTNFSSIELLIPNDDLLQYFENATSVFFAKIASNNRENIALSKIRDGLLPKLLSGEVEL